MTPQISPQMSPKPQASGRGCLFWGGIIAGALFLCFLLVGIAGYLVVRSLINEYTDTKPIQVAVAPLSDAQEKALTNRIQNFDKALTNGTPVEPLVLTADEINSLIAKQNNSPETVRLYFSFNENRVQSQLSMSTDVFHFWMLRGRYFNGSGDFQVSLNDGRLVMNIKSLSVKGKPLPDQFMQSIRSQNFADVIVTNNVGLEEALKRLQEIKIEDGKLFVIPKTPEPAAARKLEAGK